MVVSHKLNRSGWRPWEHSKMVLSFQNCLPYRKINNNLSQILLEYYSLRLQIGTQGIQAIVQQLWVLIPKIWRKDLAFLIWFCLTVCSFLINMSFLTKLHLLWWWLIRNRTIWRTQSIYVHLWHTFKYGLWWKFTISYSLKYLISQHNGHLIE